MSALIGLDWGTSSLRVYAFSATGEVTDALSTDQGILSVAGAGAGGGFEAALRDTAGPLLSQAPAAPIVASGMIGSRQGWVECPYVACPCSVTELAHHLTPVTLQDARTIHFVPGCSYHDADGVPDVMRGEETQILGAMDAIGAGGYGPEADTLFVLPGTHSKWVHLRAGRMHSFATFMTGELFQALVEHTILGRMVGSREHDQDAFLRGVRYACPNARPDARSTTATGHQPTGGILKRLFSARSLTLFEQLEPDRVHAYLSGLLIGTEVAEALAGFGSAVAVGGSSDASPARVHIVGGDALARLYQSVLDEFGAATIIAPAHAAAAGQWRIAASAGLT